MDRDAKPLTHPSDEGPAVTRRGLVGILASLAMLVVAGLIFVARDRAANLSPWQPLDIGRELSTVQGISLKAALDLDRASGSFSGDSVRATLHVQSMALGDLLEYAYRIPKGGIAWNVPPPTGVFDISAEVSTGGSDELAKRLQEVFGQVFGIRGTYEPREVPVLVLGRSVKHPEALRVIAGSSEWRFSERSDGTRTSYDCQGAPSKVADWLQERLRVPALDETGVTEMIQVSLSWRNERHAQEEPGTLKQEMLSSLEENGLSLETATRTLETLVISR